MRIPETFVQLMGAMSLHQRHWWYLITDPKNQFTRPECSGRLSVSGQHFISAALTIEPVNIRAAIATF